MATKDIDKNEVGEVNPEAAGESATEALKGAATAAGKTTADAVKTGEVAAQEAVTEAVEATKKGISSATTAAGKTITEATTAASKTITDAFKQVETIGKSLGTALQDRANVVMVRVNNDSLAYLDILVEAGITKSRSESAAFLINEGIKANQPLFNKIRDITDQITALKSQLHQTVKIEPEAE
jgi:hypothetical protein